MLVKIQFAIIAGIFDYNPKVSVAMKAEYWEKCMPAVEKVSLVPLHGCCPSNLSTIHEFNDERKEHTT